MIRRFSIYGDAIRLSQDIKESDQGEWVRWADIQSYIPRTVRSSKEPRVSPYIDDITDIANDHIGDHISIEQLEMLLDSDYKEQDG